MTGQLRHSKSHRAQAQAIKQRPRRRPHGSVAGDYCPLPHWASAAAKLLPAVPPGTWVEVTHAELKAITSR